MNLRGICGVNPGETVKGGGSRYDHKTLYLCMKFSKKNIYAFMVFCIIDKCMWGCLLLNR